jgi:multidrug efflux pump subunit AcrB
LVAIIFTPALCATLLKPVEKGHQEKKRGFFGWFNRVFDTGNRGYTSGVGYIIRRGGRHFVIYLAIVGLMGFLFTRLHRASMEASDFFLVC